MQGRADCVSLIGPAFVDGASSISAELVRQRRRANNSCGYKRRSIESSHRVASFRYFLRPFDLNWNVNIGLYVLPIQQGFTLWTPRRRDERPRRGEERRRRPGSRTGPSLRGLGGEGDDSGQQHHDDGGREEQVIAEAMLEGVHQ